MDIIFGTAGYVISLLGFLVLALLLLTLKKNKTQISILFLLCTASSVWALSSVLYIHYFYSQVLYLSIESLRNFSWYLVLCSAIAGNSSPKTVITFNQSSKLTFLFLLIVFITELILVWIPLLPYRYILLLHLVQSSIGLWLIEQLYRRTNKHDRWAIKALCLGLGLAFAYDFALYANGVLTENIDTLFFYGRGWIIVFTLPFIVMTARRVKHWSTRIYVSRDIVYSSTLLTVAGLYLLIMAFTGYYIRYIGEDWGNMFQNIFFALSGLILASLFISESLRRQLKVFITKHFYANKYEYREEWMNFTSILEKNGDSPYQVALNAMIRPFDCEQGMFVVLENGKFKKRAFYNLDDNYPESDQVLQKLSYEAIRHHWIIDIKALKSDSDTKVPFQFDGKEVSTIDTFSYIVPIADKNTIKSVCLLSRPNSTQTLNWEDRDLMWAISKQLAVYLSLYQTNKLLTENQQFDTFNRMSAFLAHDLKNILAQLQLLAKNGKRHKDNPEFIDDAFETIDSAVVRLSKVVDHLRKKNLAVNTTEIFSVESIIKSVCEERALTKPIPEFNTKANEAISIPADKERFRNMISHIIQNAQDATSTDGFVNVTTSRQGVYYTILIEDDGVGMSEDFIENRLFKPFDTTKGNSGMGIGAYDAKKFIEQLHGYINVQSQPGEGTKFTIHIPLTECVIN